MFQDKAAEVGAKTILWGCSVEPSAITPEMLVVLCSYIYIVARESLTYNDPERKDTGHIYWTAGIPRRTVTNAFTRLYNDGELVCAKLKNRLQTYIASMDKAVELL